MSAERDALEVVHVAESIRGGIATHLIHLLPLQRERYGHERIAVVAPDDQLQDLGDPRGVQVVGFRSSRNRVVSAWRARRKLIELMGNTPARIVHLHSTFAGASCRVMRIASLKHARLIYCAHGWAFLRDSRSRWLMRVIERELAHAADAIVCVSEDEHREAIRIGIPGAKLITIPNGLPDMSPASAAGENPCAPRDLRLLFIGRTDRQKGLDILLSALPLLRRRVRLDVYGGAVLCDANLGDPPGNAIFHGWQAPDVIAKALAACDAVVTPSRWEAFGFVALEAMRAGKPVIATRVGGLKDLVVHGETGYIIRPNDAHELAQTLERLDWESLRKMGEAAREVFLESFQIDVLEPQLAAIYEAQAENANG